jgi:spore coat protein H
MIVGRSRALETCLSVLLGASFHLIIPGLPAPAAAESFPAAEDVFSDHAPVLRLRIEVERDQMDALRADHRGYVRATLREGSHVIQDVGVRLKGSAGSFQPIDADKPGFTVKVNRFASGKRFRGLKKFLLNNAIQDPSYFSETVGNHLFREAGVPAVRAGFATVTLNGRNLGLYVLMEAVTADFLSRHFENPHGSLYEGPGDVTGEIDEDSAGIFVDRADLVMLSNAALEPDPGLRMRRLGEVLDMDRFISFLAMEAITWHWDGYVVGVNNYRIYNDIAKGRMVFLPHGSDQLFQHPEGEVLPEPQGMIARAVLETAEGRERYRARLIELRSRALDLDDIQRRFASLSAKVQPVLLERSMVEAEAQAEAASDLLGRISRRARSLDDQVVDGFHFLREPPRFDEKGVAPLPHWKPRTRSGAPEFGLVELDGLDGRQALWIAAGTEGACVASWRTRVLLGPGAYRIEGRVRTQNVNPFAAEGGGRVRPGGAGIRISGREPREKLTGTRPWTPLQFDFIVGAEGGDRVPEGVVEVVCELRAEGGESWFDADSLHIIRLHPTGDEAEEEGEEEGGDGE